MKLSDNISNRRVFAKKINAINFDPKKSNLKSHRGNNRTTVAVKFSNNDKFPRCLVEIDYKFRYEKIACMVDLELIAELDFKKKIESKPNPKELNDLMEELNPSFDKIIGEINEIMQINILPISKITKQGNKHAN